MDFVLRPVDHGYCRYESLFDGSLTLEDILIMNVYLDNKIQNQNEMIRSRQHG